MDETTRMWIALIVGAFVLGYLLAEWYFDGILHKADTQIADLADTVEHLVSKDDDAAVKISELEKRNAAQHEQIVQLEALLQLTPDGL